MNELEGKSILITGGTGSFGKALVKNLLNSEYNLRRIVIFSRDELKQWEMAEKYPEDLYPTLRFFLGDIRDKERLYSALKDIDYVIHAAALKQVPAAEYNPMEFIKTNIVGTENIIQAAIHNNVKKIVALSTDKAAAPVNLYGATKLCADKLIIAANNIIGRQKISFSVVRYGNVMGSRGSVIPFFIKTSKEGFLPITDKLMTRFNITLNESVEMVKNCLLMSVGGEIFIPKIPSFKLIELAEAIGPSCRKEIVGLRPGEKIHEEMITTSDSHRTFDIGKYYLILPNEKDISYEKYAQYKNHKKVEENFSYNSGKNSKFLSVNELRELIKINIDKNFKPK